MRGTSRHNPILYNEKVTPESQDQLWDPASLLPNKYGGMFFPGAQV
jgi:hypothetical protein